MKIKDFLYHGKEAVSLVGGLEVGKLGTAAKVSEHRKGERSNPKLSRVALFLEKLLIAPGTISAYVDNKERTVYVESDGAKAFLQFNADGPVISLENADETHDICLYARILYELCYGKNNEALECFIKIVSDYQDFDAVDKSEMFLLCDSFYYGTFREDADIEVQNVTASEIEAAFRSGTFLPVTIAKDFFGKAEIFEKEEEQRKKESSFFDDCKSGVYRIRYSWTEEQKQYIQDSSFLDTFEPIPEFKSLVRKIKYRTDKILDRLDAGENGIDAIKKDIINCMLLGKPGTGKSTVVYALSAACGIPVYTISFSKNTDESVVEGKNVLIEGKPQFVLTDFPKFWSQGGLFLLEEPNLAPADVTMGCFGQALEYPYVIFENGYKKRQRHPLSIVIACENVGLAGTKPNDPAFSNRFQSKYRLSDPTRENFVNILMKVKDISASTAEWVFSQYEKAVSYLRDPDVNEEDIVNSLSLRTCFAVIDNLQEGDSQMEAIEHSIVGAIAECNSEVADNYMEEVVENMPTTPLDI